MKRYVMLFLATFALFAVSLAAQGPQRGPDGGTRYHVAGVDLLAIPGRPFSAKSRTDWTRTLEDGSTVKTHLEANLARDSDGRMYRELRKFVADGTEEQPRLMEIMLYDPIAKTRTICTVAARHCVVTDYHPLTSFAVMPVGPFAQGTRYRTQENIGTNVIEGLNVIGTRETITISPGALGNERSLVTTREFWYSPDLQTNLSVIRKDPRLGTQAVQLSDIVRSDPDPALFQAPAGFAVQDVRRFMQAKNQ